MLAILLCLLLALDLAACGSGPRPAGKAKPYTEREIANAIEEYEVRTPEFSPVTHDKLAKLDPDAAPRYQLYTDGVYRTETSAGSGEDSGTAVIMLTGDLMCQERQQKAVLKDGTYDFRGSFKIVQTVFAEADLVIGNLETMLSESAPYYSEEKLVEGRPHCNAPSTYLDALRFAGFDVLVNANNHNCDCGVRGIYETLQNIDDYGFAHTGTFASKDDRRYLLFDVNGIRIAVMAYATYYNTKDECFTDEGAGVLLNRYSPEKLERDIADARSEGAEYVIAYNHWGVENTNEENEDQHRAAQEMADAGVDYIIGSHPHTLQPYDILVSADGRKVPVVYSMGNFVSHMRRPENNDTIILRMELARDGDGKVILAKDSYRPCMVVPEYDGEKYLIIPLTGGYYQGKMPVDAKDSLARIRTVMGDKIECLP